MSTLKKILGIAWIAVRELLYERVFYILLSFALISMGLSIMLGQMTYADQQKLTLDFMLAGIQLSMMLFSVFVGISLFKRELLLGSVAMVLSKPISRTSFLLGKFLGQNLVQFCVIMAMTSITLLMCLGYEKLSAVAVWQAGWLTFLELSIISAVTYLFAVNASAITTAVAAVVCFCLGHLREAISLNLVAGSPAAVSWNWVKALIPDFEMFNMKSLASYGVALAFPEFMWVTTYAFVCLFFFLFLAAVSFQRKDILT